MFYRTTVSGTYRLFDWKAPTGRKGSQLAGRHSELATCYLSSNLM